MNDLEVFRAQKDEFYRTSPQSPLTHEQRHNFEGLNYFEPNPDLNLVAEVDEFEEQDPIRMQTTTGKVQTFRRFGRFEVEVDGEVDELTIYHNQDGYFLPFVDALGGEETYSVGRYMEPEKRSDGRFQIDFNLAYNPYCAYNEMYSCPITPSENRIDVPIRAGEKIFDKDL